MQSAHSTLGAAEGEARAGHASSSILTRSRASPSQTNQRNHVHDCTPLGGSAETPRARAAIHGWKALHTEQAVSYDTARSFYADLEGQPVRKNSLRRGQSKRSSRGELSNVEAAGTVTCRRQHLPVRREVRPEEVRCLRPTSAVHSRPLPAAVRVVCPRSALLTHCIAVVWQ
jgi:hypothetical protein